MIFYLFLLLNLIFFKLTKHCPFEAYCALFIVIHMKTAQCAVSLKVHIVKDKNVNIVVFIFVNILYGHSNGFRVGAVRNCNIWSTWKMKTR